ncbi:uncharacterized protein K02A2.6-like [Armigeres subalbatus]|uniref:uncharacterized protein K02A2.6-like n=1 Tax=Armigeres subalbatus TaxID=124917 RepID=UPI002ED6A2CA
MNIDSGAAANIITKEVWEQLKEAEVDVLEMSTKVDRNLIAYASTEPMKTCGMFKAVIEAGHHKTSANFYVVENGQQCLLGDQTAKQLQVLKIGFNVDAIQAKQLKPFPKFRGVMVEIPIDENVQPMQQPYRRPPIAIEEKIEHKLRSLLEQDIIEQVNGPSPWISPMVPVTKESGDIRLCIDMRQANQAVLRETHPLPLVDELLGSVDGAVRFSKIDIREAYHQIEISERSRPITTFITKYGLFRYKRLMFGISCAPELFQKVMESIVAGLEGVIVYLDDIVVYGSSRDEHNKRLAALLERLAEYDILLNEEKCVYDVDSLEFLGHELSVKGVRPTESRIAAIQKFREPENVSELRSFLGLICYVGRFVPDLAARTAPLRELLRAEVPFKWTPTESRAFLEIKEEISKIEYLGFFNRKDSTKLIADASPNGLGAVLLQEDSSGHTRVIAYASKALSDLEKKYFQTEREALALVWAVDKFKLYLQGKRFTLLTDCKALKFLFNPKSKPCARIERWVLQLQSYKYDVEHIPGTANIADAISRLSTDRSSPRTFDESAEKYIRSVVESAVPSAVTYSEIVQETANDHSLQEVVRALHLKSEVPKMYKPYENELCAVEGVLLRGNRLVIPNTLRNRVIELAHEAHPGIAAMKRRLRQKVWWPSVDKQAEECVKRCKECTLVSSLGPPEPLKRTRMPDKPWNDIAIDFMGPLPSSHNLLVMVDYFTRFTEVVVMKQITAAAVLEYRNLSGRITVRSSLAANGEVERANRTILKHLKISQETNNSDWIWDLRTFLLMYNSTPHATTGVAPSILMFGRVLRDKLPTFQEKLDRPNEEEIRDRDWAQKLSGSKYADNRRNAKPSKLKEGDIVVAKRMIKENKLSSTFAPEEFEIVKLCGTDATLRSMQSKREVHRNVGHLKPIETSTPTQTSEISDGNAEGHNHPNNLLPPSDRPTRSTRKPSYLSEYIIEEVLDDKV